MLWYRKYRTALVVCKITKNCFTLYIVYLYSKGTSRTHLAFCRIISFNTSELVYLWIKNWLIYKILKERRDFHNLLISRETSEDFKNIQNSLTDFSKDGWKFKIVIIFLLWSSVPSDWITMTKMNCICNVKDYTILQ